MRIRVLVLSCAVFAVGLAISSGAWAQATYIYTGNDFDTVIDNTPPSGTYATSDSVSGFFQIGSSLGANESITDISGSITSFSFTDGRNTHTDSNASFLGNFSVMTDANGKISDWSFTTVVGDPLSSPGTSVGDQRELIASSTLGLSLDRGLIQECVTLGVSGCSLIRTDVGSISSNPGFWVPEPSTASLVGLGLVALAARRRARAQ